MDTKPPPSDETLVTQPDSIALWTRLAGNDKRFLQVVQEREFWSLPFPQRLSLVSWTAVAANVLSLPFVYYFINRMHYKGAVVLSCWFLGIAAICSVGASYPGVVLGGIIGIVLGHLATYDDYRRVKCNEELWPWVPQFFGTKNGALAGVGGSAALLAVIALSTASKTQAALDSYDNIGVALLLLMILAGIFIVYFIPSIVAFKRQHPNRWAIFAINLCFGSTGIAWIGSLIWALHKVHDPGGGRSAGGESGLNLFVNDTKIVELKTPLNYGTIPVGEPKIADLERIAGLFERGLLSEREYKAQKKRVLKELGAD